MGPVPETEVNMSDDGKDYGLVGTMKHGDDPRIDHALVVGYVDDDAHVDQPDACVLVRRGGWEVSTGISQECLFRNMVVCAVENLGRDDHCTLVEYRDAAGKPLGRVYHTLVRPFDERSVPVDRPLPVRARGMQVYDFLPGQDEGDEDEWDDLGRPGQAASIDLGRVQA